MIILCEALFIFKMSLVTWTIDSRVIINIH